jgi:uncharacterized repeat protein (TIGR01451 family)
MATILNTGQVFENATATTPIQTADVNFTIFNVDNLVMTKTVDRPGEIYFTGQQIVFTITIYNDCEEALTGLRFTDTIDTSVNPVTGTDFTVTTTSGTVTSASRNIIVDGIDIPVGESVIITITGVIA